MIAMHMRMCANCCLVGGASAAPGSPGAAVSNPTTPVGTTPASAQPASFFSCFTFALTASSCSSACFLQSFCACPDSASHCATATLWSPSACAMTASPAASVVFSSAFASALATSLFAAASALASLSAACASFSAAESVAFVTSSCTFGGDSALLQPDRPRRAIAVSVQRVVVRIVCLRSDLNCEDRSKPQSPSISSGIDLAFCLEPVLHLGAGRKATLPGSAVREVADPLVPFRRGQPVRDEEQRAENVSPGGWVRRSGGIRGGGFEDGRFLNRPLRFIPWNPSACNFTRHIVPPSAALPSRHHTGLARMSSTPEQRQRIVAECAVGIV